MKMNRKLTVGFRRTRSLSAEKRIRTAPTTPAGPGISSAQCLSGAQGLLAGVAFLLFLAAILVPISCRSTAGPEPEPSGGITLSLDAVPLLLKADSSAVSTIWATVLERGQPVQDSTRVSFVTTVGTISAEAMTRDGLATATFNPNGEIGLAAIIAQVRAVRDTVMVTVY
jgi:hypothetical protein